jgi:O-antigen/teichoic acid export membrane protein
VLIKKNITNNFVGTLYTSLVGILILPVYITYMGAESYGLIAFYTVLQTWFGLLDLGLTPTISRDTSSLNNKGTNLEEYSHLYSLVLIFFILIALLISAGLFLFSGVIASKWFELQSLKIDDVSVAICIIGFCTALRWMCGFYKGIIIGFEEFSWLSWESIIFSTLKFLAVILVMSYFGWTIIVFLLFQFIVTSIEVMVLRAKAINLLPKFRISLLKIEFKKISKKIHFALSISITSGLWIFISQLDKLILSGLMPLNEYGIFTLQVLAASSVIIAYTPITMALMPRLVALYSCGNIDGMFKMYCNLTAAVSIVSGSIAVMLFFFSEEIMFSWTGNHYGSDLLKPLLLYTIGNIILAFSGFPYYLQYAMGNMKFHVIGSITNALFIIPAIIIFAKLYGPVGTGIIWVLGNLFSLIFWTSFIHQKLAVSIWKKWFIRDALLPLLPGLILCMLIKFYFDISGNRFDTAIFLVLIGIMVFLINIIVTYKLRIRSYAA